MKEEVGVCFNCHKIIYCLDGFLDGVIVNDKKLYCFSCSDNKDEESDIID